MSMKPAVCVIDDDADVRASLKLLFKSKNIPFLGFASAADFFEEYMQKNVACVILDYKIPGTTGIDILREMHAKNLYFPVILLTGHATVPLTVDAIKAGAIDVLEKPFDPATLIERVHAAFAKADAYKAYGAERAAVNPKMESLTPRENQVLDQIASGKKSRKIAEELGISTKTLDIHRANIMRKMQTKTVADLVRWRIVYRSESPTKMSVAGGA